MKKIPGIINENLPILLEAAIGIITSLTKALADNFLIKSKMIFDKKKVFKFGLKKHFMECQKSILDTRRLFEEHMDEDYYYEFSNYLWDLVRHKVEKTA